MRELGYVYDRVAANLCSQRSSTVGIIITDIANTFYSELLLGVNTTLEVEGYTVLLGTTSDSTQKQDQLISTMLEHRVDGIILCPVSENSNETIEKINKLNIPIVHAVREISDINLDNVGIDYVKGAEMAVSHLIKNGHHRIAFLGGRSESSAWQQRLEGFQKAFQIAGLEPNPSLIISSAPTKEGGVAVLKKVLNQNSQSTAIFCFNNLVALGVM